MGHPIEHFILFSVNCESLKAILSVDSTRI